jgi:hypothetical protein
MRIEINAIVKGRPAHAVIELAEIKWMFGDATPGPTNVLPVSIHRVDMVDEQCNRVTLR